MSRWTISAARASSLRSLSWHSAPWSLARRETDSVSQSAWTSAMSLRSAAFFASWPSIWSSTRMISFFARSRTWGRHLSPSILMSSPAAASASATENLADSWRASTGDRETIDLRGNQNVQDTFNMVQFERIRREGSVPDLRRSSTQRRALGLKERAEKTSF